MGVAQQPAGGDELVRALARSRHEPDAFGGIVRALSPPIHAYLARRVGVEADDLLSEVWLRAFAARSTYDPARGTVRVWVFGVARHVLFAHLRRVVDVPHVSADWDEAADPWPDVDDRIAAAEVAPVLHAAIADLPLVEREMLLLVAWDGLTPTEAAAVVGTSAPTARTRLFRARQRMRERLDSTPQVPVVTADSTRGDPS